MESSYETVNGNGFVGSNGQLTSRQHHSPRLSWLDLRVFYVRISKCEVDDSTPDHLTLNHIPLDPNTLLEVNGVRASIYSDGVSSLLRRDRLDKKSEEATFVSTDSIRITGSVKFEVFDRDILVLCGSLCKCDSNGFLDSENCDSVSRMWNMNCESDIAMGSSFLKGKQLVGSDLASPTIEVYVAGCFMGTPIMLTKSLHLNLRRKQMRMGMLNSIPEHDTTESKKELSSGLALQVQESPEYRRESEGYSGNLYPAAEYWEGEDGELSWFNAGVRVGVGIGLSICVGIGLGVGLLVKPTKEQPALSEDDSSNVYEPWPKQTQFALVYSACETGQEKATWMSEHGHACRLLFKLALSLIVDLLKHGWAENADFTMH